MPSEAESLSRELNDERTPEQIELEEEDSMIYAAEEEDAHNAALDLYEPLEKDEYQKLLEKLHANGMIQYQYDESFREEVKLRELMIKAGIDIPLDQFRSPIQFNPIVV
ncbi:hypothetical protein KZO25_15340 [Halomonas sp. ANAO-440]|uniref:hypothetical protein n=1 Tax=Halomonas sp. ANAO-440 TaxID=2861360 RepID=UPI001CAA50B8|nr:hypothetical protein [Halomonas sp. ANAO-440]MBZ0331690.1 hypothetical protein [Halomonas sp. ANAO-440]